jgi:hypothetical protein
VDEVIDAADYITVHVPLLIPPAACSAPRSSPA